MALESSPDADTHDPEVVFLGEVVAGKYQESLDVLQENLDLGGPDGPHVAHWRAGSLAALGKTVKARRELEKASSFPYDFDMGNFLSAFRDPEQRDKLLRNLETLGLE